MMNKMRFLNQTNRAILRELVATDFKVRYQGSILGYLWSLLKPLMLFTILYIVFAKLIRIGGDVPFYPVYLLMGIVFWNFFSEATNTSITSIVGRADLLKKVNIPRYLVVVSSLVSAFINLGLNLIVLFIIAMFNGVEIKLTWLLLPIYIGELFMLALALGFFLSALYVKFRDVNYIWEVVLQAGFFATPIIYPLSLIAEKYQVFVMLNPMAQIIQDARWSFVTHETINSWDVLSFPLILAPYLIIAALIIMSAVYFKKQSAYFAEKI